jgi:hypothetical protein
VTGGGAGQHNASCLLLCMHVPLPNTMSQQCQETAWSQCRNMPDACGYSNDNITRSKKQPHTPTSRRAAHAHSLPKAHCRSCIRPHHPVTSRPQRSRNHETSTHRTSSPNNLCITVLPDSSSLQARTSPQQGHKAASTARFYLMSDRRYTCCSARMLCSEAVCFT